MKLIIPITHQKTDSACCGPCTLKMLNDYLNPINLVTKASLIQLCKTSAITGVQYRDLNRVLYENLSLKRQKLHKIRDFYRVLRNYLPILVLIPDLNGSHFHYSIISGYHNRHKGFYFTDCYYKHLYFSKGDTEELLKKAGFWAWSINNN